jgi:hypothetical protein
MSQERFCPNCRAALPPRSDNCPHCGTYAGDVFDGRKPPRVKSGRGGWLMILALIALAAGAYLFTRRNTTPTNYDAISTRVVHDRPGGARHAAGAKLSEAEAVRELRRAVTTSHQMRSECLATVSHGFRGGAWRFTAVDSCNSTRLGEWKVDGRTAAVTR